MALPIQSPWLQRLLGRDRAWLERYDVFAVRESAQTFFYPTATNGRDTDDLATRLKLRDLFLGGLLEIFNLDHNDPWSFFQIGGIHGLPYQPYDGDNGKEWEQAKEKWWGGYCHHGDPLFPTWHRPYVLLFEQAIIRGAASFLQKNKGSNWNPSHDEEREAYALVEKVRVPYLDGADRFVETRSIPDIFSVAEVSLSFPSKQQIQNPLRSFVLPTDLGRVKVGENANPHAKPRYAPPPGAPYTPAGYPTVRYPSEDYNANHSKSSLTVITNSYVLRGNIRATFLVDNWNMYSNHTSVAKDDTDPTHAQKYGHYTSIEFAHDLTHDYLGGPGGQMAHPDTAGLDPIFFFHHCNIDRMIALWQAIHDPFAKDTTDISPTQAWDFTNATTGGTFDVKPGGSLSETTPLQPFRKAAPTDDDSAWFTSKDVRNVKLLNYSYPELQDKFYGKWGGATPENVLKYVLRYYAPSDNVKLHWYLSLTNINKNEFNGAYSIRVFIDAPNATVKTSTLNPHYAGSFYVFARDTTTVVCKNCKPDGQIQGTIEITRTMLALNIVTYQELPSIFDDTTKWTVDDSPFHPDSFTFVFVASDGVTPLYPSKPPTPVISWRLDVDVRDVPSNFNNHFTSYLNNSVRRADGSGPLINNFWKKDQNWGTVPLKTKSLGPPHAVDPVHGAAVEDSSRG